MKKQFEQVLGELKNKSYVSVHTIQEFSKRIQVGEPFTKKERVTSHFCSFFVPYNVQTHSIFAVHHKKANDWIPPGGHIDPRETPLQTVQREFHEELGVVLSSEPLYLVNASTTNISHPKSYCSKHYDFWYVVDIEKKDFIFDKGEFYDAGWFNIDEVWKTKTKDEPVRSILKTLSTVLKNVH